MDDSRIETIIRNKKMENLLDLSTNVDRHIYQLQRIAILYSRCGNDRHQDMWNAPDSDLQYKERAKVSKVKRGNHPHRHTTKRRPKQDDNEIVEDNGRPLGPGYPREIIDKYRSGKLTKGELRDFMHKRNNGKDYSGQRIEGSSEHYDPRIDIASTKPGVCNKELIKLLKSILPENYGSIDKHQSYSNPFIPGVDERHVSNGIDTTIKCINREVHALRNLADDFSCYSGEEFVHHPYHQHKNIISNICNELDIITNKLCLELEFVGKLFNICDYIINTTIPSLQTITMKIRSNIIIMQGSFYSKSHALKVVAIHPKNTTHRANAVRDMINNNRVPSKKALVKLIKTKENNQFVEDIWNTQAGRRSDLICQLEKERITSITNTTAHVEHHRTKMVKKIRDQHLHRGYVPKGHSRYKQAVKQKKCHDDIIARGLETTDTTTEATQYAEALTDDVLKKAGHYYRYKTWTRDAKKKIIKEIVAKQNELDKEELSEWIKYEQLKEQYNNVHIGSLVLAVNNVEMQSDWTPIITTDLYAPPKPTQISNTIGLIGNRLYFSPHQFPVTDVDTAGDSEAFQQLKDYIINQSSLVGDSPLIFHGTESGGKRFICKYALKYNWEKKFGPQTPFKRCSFALVVKWDKYGFYINSSKPNPLYNRAPGSDNKTIILRKYVVGCEFHNHPTTTNSKKRKHN